MVPIAGGVGATLGERSGHTGIGGRPRGARNKLGEAFLQDLHADWEMHGKSVIERVRRDDPSTYLRVMASVVRPASEPEVENPFVRQHGAWANIPPKRNRIEALCISPYLYRARNLVERFFNKIKHCRRVATRYDKLAANYLAFVQLASIRLWLRVNESTA
jgi:hypothetical protein